MRAQYTYSEHVDCAVDIISPSQPAAIFGNYARRIYVFSFEMSGFGRNLTDAMVITFRFRVLM